MWAYADGSEKPYDYYVISEIVDDSQIHRFKDNKMGDASIAFFLASIKAIGKIIYELMGMT